MLGVFDAPYPAIDSFVTEARIDDDGAHDLTGWLQQQMTAIGQIRHNLHRGDILWIFLQIHLTMGTVPIVRLLHLQPHPEAE